MTNDGDMIFPPGQRRDKPSFEPPPWEREQFDELAKRRQAEDPIEQKDEERGAEGTAAGPDALKGGPVPDATQEAGTEAPEPGAAADEPAGSELDPKQVEVLMMGLRAEEPRLEGTYSKITMVVGALSAFIGLVLMTWGLMGMATPKRAGAGPLFLVGVPLIFGLGFIAGGVWVMFKSLRQQGVL
jgi:hypothetical protein